MTAKKTTKVTTKTTAKNSPKKTVKKVSSNPSNDQMAAKMKLASASESTSGSTVHSNQSKIVNGLVLVLLSVIALSAGIVVGDYVFAKSSFSSIKMPVSVPFLGGEKQAKTANKAEKSNTNEGRETQAQPMQSQTSITIDGVEIDLPNESSSDEELMKFGQQITSLSKATDTVTIGENCQLSPSVPKISLGGSVTFTNTSTTDVELFLLEDRRDVAAGESITVEVGDQPMTTGISCSDVGMVGFLHIE